MQARIARTVLALLFAVGWSGTSRAQQPAPVPFQTFVVVGPQNSRVEFVGTHVGDEPKPRLGGFADFHGLVGVDPAAGTVTSVQLGFEVGSIWTEFDDLTKHLMNAEFFNLEKFPHASFSSTSVTANPTGGCTIKGDLTLMGNTAEISFPAKYTVTDAGLVLEAQFMLDRTQFGMDQMTDGVEKQVSISFVVGTPDRKAESKAGNGGEQPEEEPNAVFETVKVYLPEMK